MLPLVTTVTNVVRLGTKFEPHHNLMIISESVSSCEKIYSRVGQLYELLKPHHRKQVRQEMHINKLQYTFLILWLPLYVHPKTVGDYVEIKCQLDATDDFYCRSYCLLESIIQVVVACGIWCFGFQVVGMVWS